MTMAVLLSRQRSHAAAPVAERAASTLPALTGLRFVAVLCVVVYHFGTVRVASAGLFGVLQSVGQRLSTYGLLGVNCFFILSGFVLAYRYIDVMGTLRGSRRAFWGARFARVYPLYAVALLLGCGPLLWYHDAATQRLMRLAFLPSAALLQAWVPALSTAWNPPGWSLSVEAFFYLCFPLLVVPIGRLRSRQLVGLVAASWTTMLLAPSALLMLLPAAAHAPGSYWEQIVSYEPVLRLPEFMLGVALGRLWVLRGEPRRTTGGRPHFYPPPWLVGLGLVTLLAYAPRLPFVLLHDGLGDPLFAALIWSLARGKGQLAGLLSRPGTVLLGEASYGVYLLHWPLWMWLQHLGAVPAAPFALPYFAAYLVLTVALSLLSLRLVEMPARRALRQAFTGRSCAHRPVAEHIAPARPPM